MLLVLTIEIQSDASRLVEILREVTNKLDFITNKDSNLENVDNYGLEFASIAVIPSCMDESFWRACGWKERKQIWRKKREADIRLRMDYDRFMRETPENQRLLFIDILISSIEEVKSRSVGDFKGEKLILDILNALEVSTEMLENL